MTPSEWVVGDSSNDHTVTAPTSMTRPSTARYAEMMDSARAPACLEIARTPFAAVFTWICPSTSGALLARIDHGRRDGGRDRATESASSATTRQVRPIGRAPSRGQRPRLHRDRDPEVWRRCSRVDADPARGAARCSEARAQVMNQIRALIITAPDSVRQAFPALSGHRLVKTLARTRPGTST